MARIVAEHLSLAYDRREVVHDLDLALPEGRVTFVVGANGSGKSTLLRGLSRLLTPSAGTVLLDGADIHALRGKDLARRLGLLPQTPIAPDGVTVRELVSRGRFPHHGLFPQWTPQDEEAVTGALAATRTADLAERQLEELSGGQRQRVWIAMALAQETDVLLLDEPTTYLDVTHQLEVLDVVADLNRERGTTVVIVLHDLGLAARYADHLVVVRDGRIHSQGSPAEVVTETMVREAFGLEARVIPDPVSGTPLVLPIGRRARPGTGTGTAATTDPGPVPALAHSAMLAAQLTVVGAADLGPSLRRLTFAGTDLAHVGIDAHPLDLRVKLVFPGPGARADLFAPVRPGGMLDPVEHADWYRTWLQVDPAERGWMRTYTIRDQRAAGHPGNATDLPEIDIDVVLHAEPDPRPGRGVGARWARAAREGDALTMLGPNRHLVGPDYGGIEFRPGTARTVLLAGDETAAPAIGSILEALPASISGHAIIEVPHAADEQPLVTRSGVRVTWLAREGRAHGELLDAEVRRLMSEHIASFHAGASPGAPAQLEDVDIDGTILWETVTGHGSFYAWLAGEAGVIKGLRRHLVSELGLDRAQVSFMGYWRAGRPEH